MADVDGAVSVGHALTDDKVAVIDAELYHHILGGSEIDDVDVAHGADGSDGGDPGDPDDTDTSPARVDGDNDGDGIELAGNRASIVELCRHEQSHLRRPTTERSGRQGSPRRLRRPRRRRRCRGPSPSIRRHLRAGVRIRL